MACNLNIFCKSVLSYCGKFSYETVCKCLGDNVNKFCDIIKEENNDARYLYFLCALFFICNVFICVCKINLYGLTDESFSKRADDPPPTYTENL